MSAPELTELIVGRNDWIFKRYFYHDTLSLLFE